MKVRVKDRGKSESQTVMVRIRVETLSGAKASRLPQLVLNHEKAVELFEGGKQMNANVEMMRACAPADRALNWNSIDWNQCHENVRKLQARIVKATKEGRWGKVKSLQRLLTTSFSGKALAVKRVTSNKGRNTPGVDGEIWSSSEAKSKCMLSLRRRGYHPAPLRRIYIPKSNGKRRPLGIPTLHDRAMQALYLLALDPVSETTADPNSYGFRPRRSTADAIEQCFKVLAQTNRAQWVLEGDIRGCFDNISHDWLMTNIPMDKVILRKWLNAGYMESKVRSLGRLRPRGLCTRNVQNILNVQ